MSYTIAEAREIMNETSRILANDAKREKQRVNARAAATTAPPSATELFCDYVVKEMDADESLSFQDAIRRVASEHPTLHEAYILEHNKQRIVQETRDRKEASRARAARNR